MNLLQQHSALYPVARLAALALAAAGLLLVASPGLAQSPLNNPIVRNSLHRSGIADSAPVAQGPRNSETRPTLPAAPPVTDTSRTTVPAPDRSRDGTRATPAPPAARSQQAPP